MLPSLSLWDWGDREGKQLTAPTDSHPELGEPLADRTLCTQGPGYERHKGGTTSISSHWTLVPRAVRYTF